MKKLLLVLVSMSAILFCACKDEFPEYPDPNPKPVPVVEQMRMTGNFDFYVEDEIDFVGIATIHSRTGASCLPGETIYKGKLKDFNFLVDTSFNYLKGKTVELVFIFSYYYQGVNYSAWIIKNVTFSENTNVGDIGYSEYDWITCPRLSTVVYGTEEKTYYEN